MRLLLYINPATYDLKKYDAAAAANEYSDSDAWNMGMRATVEKSLRLPLILRGGVEWFGRRNVTFENRIEPTGDGAENDISHPLTDGTRDDISAFFTLDYTGLPGWDFLAGIRYTWFALSARADDTDHDKEAGSPSYFVGVTRKFGRSVNLFVNIGRAFRMPGLSESFYTGLTGRRYVIGNPDLNPETSFNIEGGFRLFTRKLYAGISLFSHTVNDMIERYKNEDGIYTYDNIQRGIFTGAELEVQYFPIKNVELFGHYFHYRGRSSTENEPLNDVPAPKIFVGGKLYLGQLWAEINYLHSFEKNDPGPAEVENAAYDVINIKGGFYFSSRLSLNLKVANLLNEMYYANPDPDIPPAKGVEFSAGIHYYF
jgi:iron complex outermembrane receptor protein